MPSPQQPVLRVQINQIDYSLIRPGSLDNSPLPRVPVIRIYGTSSTGKKTCLHVHQVYPYFFVEYSGKLNSRHVNYYISRLNRSLNYAIDLSLKRDPRSSGAQYIRAISLVKGIHFYGFHASYSPFLKIFIVDPAYINRAATILQSGTVMGTRFRVYESHLSYILQFMCDFGLYGCGWIDLGDVLQRGAQNTQIEEFASTGTSDINFNVSPYFRQSRMPLEVDVIAPQILNRHHITARNLHHKIKIPAPQLSTEPLVMSVRELWEDERNRRLAHGLNPSPEIPIDPSESSRGPGGDWVAEAEWWEDIRKRIEHDTDTGLDIQDNPNDWENWVMTTFESVEALWEAPWKVWRPIRERNEATSNIRIKEDLSKSQELQWNDAEEVAFKEQDSVMGDIDISALSSQEITQLIELEEAEWARLSGDDVQHPEDDLEHDIQEESEDIFDDEQRAHERQDVDWEPFDHSTTSDPFEQGSQTFIPVKEPQLILPSPPYPLSENPLDIPQTPTRMQGDSRSPNIDDTPSQVSSKGNSAALISDREKGLPALTADVSWPPKGSHNLIRDEGMTKESPQLNPRDLLRPPKRRKSSHAERDEEIPNLSFFSSPSPSSGIIEEPRSIVAEPIRQSYAFDRIKTINMNKYIYALPPPTTSEILKSLEDGDTSNKIYRAPFYSTACDIPDNREYAGLLYDLKNNNGITYLGHWDNLMHSDIQDEVPPLVPTGIGGWEYASSPPSTKEVKIWLTSTEHKSFTIVKSSRMKSQIEGPTQKNIYGLKDTPDLKKASDTWRKRQPMSTLSLEVFAPAGQQTKVPDGNTDEIVAIFYAYQISETDAPRGKGTIIVQAGKVDLHRIHYGELEIVPNELDLINRIVDVILDFDPDILVGWKIQNASWGYLHVRGQQYGLDIADLISRAPTSHGAHTALAFKVTGRHVLNLWRIMRSEKALTSYTLENVVFHTLQKRTPYYSHFTLTEWYRGSIPGHIAYILRYFSDRTLFLLEILERSEVITKTAEFARVFGVDFFSVISRGSQFKVESFLFRIAKPESFVLISPSRQDVGKQNAAECMPLIMEPMSAFYSSPLVVLDFQSLYPSIMIAYNYCYSTCLGRVKQFQGRNKLGVVDLNQPPLASLSTHIQVAPNGIMYVKAEVRKGLLGRMLLELLNTRVMIKQAMKSVSDKGLHKILDARQLSLKYISNVTYGYTGATYSGRMPAVEIADSIVQSGRETLEKAIMTINTTKKWGAKVVYGDTDSVFVYLEGKTKEQAFRIGNEIADTITALNPSPVKLKFEKVYLPCVLLAKKRYVGFKFEHIDDKEAIFDAKGIETVRRDGIHAQRKMVENCLKILFRTRDLSDVKEYCCRSWTKFMEHRTSIQDFIFAKEVRMGTYSGKGPPPPGVMVAAKRMVEDPNYEPQYGERIPYVIIRRPPGYRLVERAMDPLEVLNDCNLQLDTTYYISRVLIPPLERIFSLVGADVRKWFSEMPKMHSPALLSSPIKVMDERPDRPNIHEHFHSSQCAVCGRLALEGLCDECYFLPKETIARLSARIRINEQRLVTAHKICATCTSSKPGDPIRCESLDCPWLYSRKRAENNRGVLDIVEEFLEELDGTERDIPLKTDYELSIFEGASENEGEEEGKDEVECLLYTPQDGSSYRI